MWTNTELTEHEPHPIDRHWEEPSPMYERRQSVILVGGIGVNCRSPTQQKLMQREVDHPAQLGDALLE